MKTTLIVVSLFSRLGITLLESLLSNTVTFSNPVTAALAIIYNPNIVSSNNFLAQVFSFMKDAPSFVNALLNIFLLYSPTVFAGDRIWIWLPFGVLGAVTTLSVLFGFFIK